MRVVLLCFVGLLCSCTSQKLNKLPTYDQAIAAAPEPKKPRLFNAAQLSDRVVQETVPYAVISASLDGNDVLRHAQSMWERCLGHMPDVVVYEDGKQSTSVAPGAPVYFGTALVFSSTQHSCAAVVCRDAPACLPFTYRGETLMVLELGPGAREAGLIEGDTVTSINSIPLATKQPPWASPLHQQRIEWRPGQSVRVGLIRPGRGAFDVEVRLIENARSYATEQDHYSVAKRPMPVVERDSTGKVKGWTLPRPVSWE